MDYPNKLYTFVNILRNYNTSYHTMNSSEKQKATLTVFKASAGSGKTFTLAVEYIKLLIENPYAFENILAVTFTNKATEEMKRRILSQLYGLWKRLPKSESYMTVIKDSTGYSEEFISQQAEKALRLLLHNYHFFKVQTIDTFFQSVLRNLARELQLNTNLRVTLNESQVVDEAVDELIDSLADDKNTMNVVMGYVEDNLANDKSWNVTQRLKDFGSTIFKELYKRNRKRMDAIFADPDFFDNYKKEMQSIMHETERKYIEIGKSFLKEADSRGLEVTDFSNKEKGPVGYFIKLSKGAFHDSEKVFNASARKGMDNPEAWSTKTSKLRNEIISFAESFIIPLMREAETTRSQDAILYNSAIQTLKHLNDVRLLRKIEEMAKSLNDSAQRFMLSDTQSLLNDIIDDGDSPFIFEKTGAYLKHVMIDEFQDTSTIQWANFKTILKECMGNGERSLIVGDVKQSIYRFRSGDWRLLNGIENEFYDGEIEFEPRLVNYRSDRNVIAFNNEFFRIASTIEVNGVMEHSSDKADQLKKAYEDVCQDIPEWKSAQGLVNIVMLPHEQLDTMEERTLNTILDLLEKGVMQKDIAILVRGKKEIASIASYIEDNSDVSIVSDEAFKLGASSAVRLVINAMTALARPDDTLAIAALKKEYGKELPKDFTEHHNELLTMTLHDMVEEIVRIFDVDTDNKESAYLTTFFDQLSCFSSDMSPVLEDFLTVWEEELCRKTIETPELNGIRILTIHKSKGLEFKHVIIPFCNWKGNPSVKETIWATPTVAPFSKLPLVPLDYYSISTLKGSIYEQDGVEEYIQEIVDNINLLYVAMTRAGSSLFIIGERNTKSFTRSKVICETIAALPDEIDGMPLYVCGQDNEEEPLEVTYGKLVVENKREENDEENVFTPTVMPINVGIRSYRSNAEYRQSNKSREFAEDAIDETDRQRYIRMGTVMHQVFSTIHTMEDVEPMLQRMEFDGTLYDDELTKDEVIASIKQKFNHEKIKTWFSNRWTIYNECSILTKNGEQRPDRVMTDGNETIVVDFKFGKPFAEHHEQVKGYMELLRNMGMPDVQGYLWYISSNDIVPVNP